MFNSIRHVAGFFLALPKYIQIWFQWCLEWICATGSSSLQDADRR